jgi:hypothetical protein
MLTFSLFNGLLLGLGGLPHRVGEGLDYILSKPLLLTPIIITVLIPIPAYYYEGLIGGAIIFYLTYLAYQLGEWSRNRKEPKSEFLTL